MKKVIITSLALVMVALFTSCGIQRNYAGANNVNAQQQPASTNPFGETYVAPCEVYDTPNTFAASTSFRGSSMQRHEVQKNALLAAQEIIRLKMKHAYKGMVSEYSASVGNNRGNDVERAMTSAGDRMIDAIINETSQSCTRWSAIYDDGSIECYIAITISKEETAKKITEEVKNNLTDEEKLRIGFNEKMYREKMQQQFEAYKAE